MPMDAFGHIRMVIGFILSISIARLLLGAVKIIQHPGRVKPYSVHLLWAFYIFILLIHFWWWEYKLRTIPLWTFQEYFFLIIYIILYFVLCALLFPDDLKDYQDSYEAYFYSRKHWFFGVLAFTYAADVLDTAMKGAHYFAHFGWEYPIRNAVHFMLCLVAMWVNDKRFHMALVVFFILYELSYVFRLYGTTG